MRSMANTVAPLTLSAIVFTLLAAAAPAAAQAQDLTVYDDALQNGFQDWSYGGGTSFTSTGAVHTGSYSISFDQSSYSSAISFAHSGGSYTVAQYPTLHFWVHGGATGNQKLQVVLQLGGAIQASAALDTYITGGAIAAGAWREVTVGFASAPLSYSGSFDRIDLEGNVPSPQQILYVDDVSLVPNAIQIEHDVTVASMVSDRFTWHDGTDQPRVAVLAHNDTAPGPGGSQGGALREFRYQMPDNSTRIAGVTTYGNGGYGGFGYVVSHRGDGTDGIVGDDSPLGFAFAGTFQRVFEGRHHAIFRFTQMYPRHSSTTATPPNTTYNVPVTIDWIFSTGRDNPVWAVTWDLSSVPANSLNDDSRAPYGELNIDGTGFQDIDGVGWGDRYKFFSTTAPVTLSSTWNWTQPNTVPYVKLWITGTDATMGTVQTQTLMQQDAGAGRNPFYHDLTGNWGFTSAHGNAGEDVMPWQDSWPFQANSFSIGSAPSSNNNARLTWGAMYGFLGQASYTTNNGLVATSSGYPKKSYSTYVVLGTHTSAPVEVQVTQVETVQSLALSATIGSVVTTGPAGAARADNVTYAPAGYNHVYGALAFAASGNSLDANIAVGAGTLAKPLLILGSYTGAYPTIKLGGVTLVSDVDYFPSLRADASELWITLNRDFLGATNHLEVLPSCSPVPTPTIQASGLTTFCSGGSVTLTSSAGSSYLWSTGATTSSISVTTSGSYWVQVTNANGCQSAQSDSVVVTVNPIPSAPTASNNGPYCAGGAISLAVSTVAGATYSWTGPSGYASTVQNPTISNATTAMAGTYSVTATVGSCTSAAATTNVVVNPIPGTPIATNNSPLCAGSSLNLTTPTVSGATYAWTGPNGFTSTQQLPTIPTVTLAAAGSYNVTVTVNSCASSAGSTTVVINANPATPTITAPASVSSGATEQTASVPAHAGSTYAWGITNGTITAGQGTSQITFTAGTAGTPLTLSVTETNASGCVSAAGTATVTVLPAGSAVFFYTVTPCRQLDTRSGSPISPGGTLAVALTGAPCGIPSGATSVSVNAVVTQETGSGHLTIYPADKTQPLASTINFNAGQTRANNAILPLSSDGTGGVNIYNGSGGTTHVVIDINGYFQ
jgi:PKD-like domain